VSEAGGGAAGGGAAGGGAAGGDASGFCVPIGAARRACLH